jgi:hypothetical protein
MNKKKKPMNKAIEKRVAPPTSFGTDPNDPWSAKANINEASRQALLDKFLMSRGVNPKFVTKDVRIGHSKSGAFLKYQKDHMGDPVKPLQREDTFLDPKAATPSPQTYQAAQDVQEKSHKISKAAKLVKSIYKKKRLGEELTNTDVENKSVATYGKKKPQMKQGDFEKKLAADDETGARAVLKGGTTMTGAPRDTIIIDPSLRKPTIKGMNSQPDFPEKNMKKPAR